MHIPDGYLGPPTWLGCWSACVALWTVAGRRLRASLDQKRIPLLAIGAAFSFLIMMFNVPAPGGTSGHAVGSVLVALAVGPWAASLAVSIAQVMQALFFGDGGITAIGANCLTMAYVMPFAGWAVFRLLSLGLKGAGGRAVAAGIAGYVGLNAAALATAVLFGLQPLLHRSADGRALYAPYPLEVAVPVMMTEHLLFFGVLEGLVTGFVVYALSRSETPVFPVFGDAR